MGEEKCTESEETKYSQLLYVFAQSWEYIRHAQTTFWQSFTTIYSVVAGMLILYFSREKQEPMTGIFVLLFAIFLMISGFLVTLRSLVILKEHFLTINLIRNKCGIDRLTCSIKIKDKLKSVPVIPPRWKTYEPKVFGLWRPETSYLNIATHIYLLTIAGLVSLGAFIWMKTVLEMNIYYILCLSIIIVLEVVRHKLIKKWLEKPWENWEKEEASA